MPSLSCYRKQHSLSNNCTQPTIGMAQKYNADMNMEVTWDRDIQSKVAYIYDYYHDDSPTLSYGMTYENTTKTKIDIKFIIAQYQSLAKDDVEYHIQFLPSQKLTFDQGDELYYYETEYRQRYDASFPIGMYIDIPNEQGIYEKWLICGMENQNQFPKYFVLKCNYYYHWISEENGSRKTNRMWAVSRSQSSYNSGLWSADKSTKVENQEKAFFPLNTLTEYLYYTHPKSHNNQRMIISALTKHPIVWQISKVENHAPKGIQKITFYQTTFNDNTDYVNYETGEMYADYYSDEIPVQKPDILDNTRCVLTASTNTIKIGGGYKTITASFVDIHGDEIDFITNEQIQWKCYMKDIDVTENGTVTILHTNYPNKIKVKYNGDLASIQQKLKVTAQYENILGNIEFVIISL